jgi:hypothetical protein
MMASICQVIDFLVDIFYKLSGLDTVKVDGKESDLLSHFLQSDNVKIAFFAVVLVGVMLLCLFVIMSIIRSEYVDANQKKTKGQILTKAGHSLLLFLLVPFVILAGITLTNVIMGAINGSMLLGVTGGGRASFGGQILVTSGNIAWIGGGNRLQIEQNFINGTFNYSDLDLVKRYYKLRDFNFFIGIGSSIVLLVLFALAALRFVQRIFDIILLYIISPVSISTIPIDDGSRFKLWRELLVTKVLSAYGIILSMNLFFLIIPQINKIQFYDNAFGNGLIQLLFTIGGAFAVTKAYMVIAQLTGNNGGANEAQQMMAGVSASSRMARGVYRIGAGSIKQVVGGSDMRKGRNRHGGKDQNKSGSLQGRKAGVVGMANSATKAVANNVDSNVQATNGNVKSTGSASSNEESSGFKQAIVTTGKIATMPVGVLKDVYTKGAVGAGKNIWPRIKSVGSSASNVAPKTDTETKIN